MAPRANWKGSARDVASDVMPVRPKSGWRVIKVIGWLTGIQEDD